MLKRLNVESSFIDGLRVTDKVRREGGREGGVSGANIEISLIPSLLAFPPSQATLEVAEMVLCGLVNKGEALTPPSLPPSFPLSLPPSLGHVGSSRDGVVWPRQQGDRVFDQEEWSESYWHCWEG